jgi:hypothetical protein
MYISTTISKNKNNNLLHSSLVVGIQVHAFLVSRQKLAIVCISRLADTIDCRQGQNILHNITSWETLQINFIAHKVHDPPRYLKYLKLMFVSFHLTKAIAFHDSRGLS